MDANTKQAEAAPTALVLFDEEIVKMGERAAAAGDVYLAGACKDAVRYHAEASRRIIEARAGVPVKYACDCTAAEQRAAREVQP